LALPANGTAWPPKDLRHVLAKYREYDAWVSNNLNTLAQVYAKNGRPGLMERVRTWFLGAKDNTEGGDTNGIHVSLAQEITRTSANLLYAEPATATVVAPTDTADVEAVQDRLDLITGPQFQQTMVSAAEVSSGLGGVFLRVCWDSAVFDHAFVTKVDPDMAWPEFKWGQLSAVTFWRTIGTEHATVWRHLERHEIGPDGNGIIIHGLYEGTTDDLGTAKPFAEHKATAWLAEPSMADSLIDGNTISTLTPGLGAVYAPNILPSSLWRHDQLGANLGRSDLEGIEQQLDALDELYSSWLRDIRLGKGRLIVGESMLRDLGAGMGAGFDLDKSIFTPVKAAPSSAGSEKMAIENVQFDIRTEDFMKAIDHFRRIILSAAGYSPGTFGMQDDGAAVTATEVAARQQLSFTTRKRKVLGLKPALETILTKALAVDAAVFPAGGAQPLAVVAEFPDGVADDPKAIAEQNQLDYNGQSASIRERVRKRNPDWDDTAVDEEVARIRKDFNLGALEDPATFGTDGQGIRIPADPLGATE
jgi:A118 family predicted phage portal protein